MSIPDLAMYREKDNENCENLKMSGYLADAPLVTAVRELSVGISLICDNFGMSSAERCHAVALFHAAMCSHKEPRLDEMPLIGLTCVFLSAQFTGAVIVAADLIKYSNIVNVITVKPCKTRVNGGMAVDNILSMEITLLRSIGWDLQIYTDVEIAGKILDVLENCSMCEVNAQGLSLGKCSQSCYKVRLLSLCDEIIAYAQCYVSSSLWWATSRRVPLALGAVMSTLMICPMLSMIDIESMLKMKKFLISCTDDDELIVQQIAKKFDTCWQVYNKDFS